MQTSPSPFFNPLQALILCAVSGVLPPVSCAWLQVILSLFAFEKLSRLLRKRMRSSKRCSDPCTYWPHPEMVASGRFTEAQATACEPRGVFQGVLISTSKRRRSMGGVCEDEPEWGGSQAPAYTSMRGVHQTGLLVGELVGRSLDARQPSDPRPPIIQLSLGISSDASVFYNLPALTLMSKG